MMGAGLAAGLLMAAAACAQGAGTVAPSGAATASGSGAGAATGSSMVTVFAAASLTETFTELGEKFEAEHPGSTVQFSFGPSSGLAQQITSGAPADVFASASAANMEQVTQAGAAAEPVVFAQNVLEIAVPQGNPGGVTDMASLAGPEVTVALCEEQVPCGKLAATVLARAGVEVTPVTREKDVKSVLTKVRLGEVDAGLVYATDVRAAAADVEGIAIPADVNGSTDYPIAVLTDAPDKQGAQAFTDFVLSAEGKAVLREAGFTTP